MPEYKSNATSIVPIGVSTMILERQKNAGGLYERINKVLDEHLSDLKDGIDSGTNCGDAAILLILYGSSMLGALSRSYLDGIPSNIIKSLSVMMCEIGYDSGKNEQDKRYSAKQLKENGEIDKSFMKSIGVV